MDRPDNESGVLGVGLLPRPGNISAAASPAKGAEAAERARRRPVPLKLLRQRRRRLLGAAKDQHEATAGDAFH